MADNQAIPQETIEDIKKQVLNAESGRGNQDELFTRYREMYFMDNTDSPKYVKTDKKDIKITPSPSSRNEVIGMQRLLNTSEMNVKVKVGDEVDGNSDKIERALKKVLSVSSEGKRARVESDAMLSAVLYGPVTIYAESIDDLMKVKGIKEYRRKHLEKLRVRSPFLIRAINPEESYIEREDGQITLHIWKSTVKGTNLKTKWGVECSANTDYILRDVYTPEYHLVYADGIKDVLFIGEHLLGCVPVFSSLAGGSELFHKPEEQINSYLYAKAKGELDKRENSLLTTIFTNVHQRGLVGPLIAVDPDNAPDSIEISYQGGVRIIKAKATTVDDKVIDPSLMIIKNLLDELSGQSTIQKQTLGQSIDNSTFSGLAMLSSSGKLPMVDSQRALEGAFKDCFEYILYRIKAETITNPLIEPSEIPEQYELEVTFKPNLPQDTLRNAQIAQTLSGKVSDEWIMQEILQISDAAGMRKQITREALTNALRAKMTQDPNYLGELFNKIMGIKPPPPPQAPPTGPGNPEEQAMMSGNPNMEATPETEPMTLAQERM